MLHVREPTRAVSEGEVFGLLLLLLLLQQPQSVPESVYPGFIILMAPGFLAISKLSLLSGWGKWRGELVAKAVQLS